MLEKTLEAKFRHEVARLGAFSEKFVSSTAGVPDRIVIAPGGIVDFVELKAKGGRLRKIQEVWHARADDRGVVVHLVEGEEGLRAYLAGLEGRIRSTHEAAPHVEHTVNGRGQLVSITYTPPATPSQEPCPVCGNPVVPDLGQS